MILHPFLSGRLARRAQIKAWIAETQASLYVCFASLSQIADHLNALQEAGTWSPVVETLPYYSAPILQAKD